MNYKKRGGFYWVDNKPYASVTDIISILDKPALRYWFGQQVYRAFSANDRLSEKEALSAPYKANKKAKDRGSTVHSIVEAWKQTGKYIDSIPAEFKGYAKAFYSFVSQHKIKLIEHEKQVVNDKYGYAGTLDIICQFNGNDKKTILDCKTGKGLYPEVELQLSAYRAALGKDYDIAAVCLMEDGTFQFAKYNKDRFKEFLACLTIWKWQNEEKIKQLKLYGGQK